MKGVILAAGRGARLAPLTDNMPKPLLPVAGRPMLDYVIDGFLAAGVDEALIVVGWRGQAIRDHYGNGDAHGLNIEYREQRRLLGTGHALLEAAGFPDGPFLLSFGDIIMRPENHAGLREFFESGGFDAALTLDTDTDPCIGAAVTLDGERVVKIVEKPPRGSAGTPYNNRGVFVLGRDVFSRLENTAPGARGEIELTSAIQAMIDDGLQVGGFVATGPTSDMGAFEAIRDFENRWTPGI